MDESVSSFMLTKEKTNFPKFFYPEIKDFNDEEIMKGIEEELLSIDINIFDNFNEKMKAMKVTTNTEDDSEIAYDYMFCCESEATLSGYQNAVLSEMRTACCILCVTITMV